MLKCRLALALAIPALTANAQPGTFQAPVTGFVFSPISHTLRPIAGVRGASHLGKAVLDEVDWASPAPGGRVAVTGRSGRTEVVEGLSGSGPSAAVSPAGPLIDLVDRIAWSRDGRFAAIYSSSGGLLQRLRLGGAEVGASAPADCFPLGRVTALAIDRGGRIAAGFAGSGLYLIEEGQSPTPISSRQTAAIAFDDAGRLYAIDLETRRILEFGDATGPAEVASLEDPGDADLAVSANGRYLLVTGQSPPAVRVYDIHERSLVNTIPLDFAPSRLERLSADGLFLLNGDRRGEWLLVLDAADVPAVYFVPAASEEEL